MSDEKKFPRVLFEVDPARIVEVSQDNFVFEVKDMDAMGAPAWIRGLMSEKFNPVCLQIARAFDQGVLVRAADRQPPARDPLFIENLANGVYAVHLMMGHDGVERIGVWYADGERFAHQADSIYSIVRRAIERHRGGKPLSPIGPGSPPPAEGLTCSLRVETEVAGRYAVHLGVGDRSACIGMWRDDRGGGRFYPNHSNLEAVVVEAVRIHKDATAS